MIELSYFPHAQKQRAAIQRFVEADSAVSCHLYTDGGKQGFFIRWAGEQHPHLPHVKRSETRVGEAVERAIAEWLTSKLGELEALVSEVAERAEISIAQELQQDAIQLLSVANK